MIKYGIVGAIALAVLVAATWDGKKKTDVAKGDTKVEAPPDSAVSGEVGSVKPGDRIGLPGPSVAAPVEAPKEPPRPIEDELLKYSVQRGDSFKSIARTWLGDERLAEELLKANPRITDAKHLRPGFTLVFPKSKFAGSRKPVDGQAAVAPPPPGEGTAGSSLAAGMKKDETKPTDVPAGDKKYVVKSGDTLYGIAGRELGKASRWKEILKLNNLSSESLKKGQTIILPEK